MTTSIVIDNRYELIAQVGGGGMGTVHQTRDRLTNSVVALKRIRFEADHSQPAPGQTASDHLDNLRLALAAEFATLASLRHQHIISVLDYGFDDQKQPFFTMDYLPHARTITQAAAGLPLHERTRLIIELLLALAYLHRRDVIHRDLKPSNVLVGNNTVRVLDFGLAIVRQSKTDPAQKAAGTLTHMSPEVLRGQPASAASDLYAVGVMAYQIFTGRHPFDTGSTQQLIHDILYQEPDLSRLPDGFNVSEIPNIHDLPTHDAGVSPRLVPRPSPDVPTQMKGDDDSPTRLGPPTPPIPQNNVEQTDVLPAAFEPQTDALPPSSLVVSGQNPVPLPSADSGQISLRSVIGRLLEKDPARRYHDANSVIADLCAAVSLPPPQETAVLRESYLEAARFVGRDAELALLREGFEEVVGKRPSTNTLHAYLIGGESGVGKSRLMRELRTHALVEGGLVLVGQGVEGGGLPYQLWRDPVRRLILHSDVSDFEAGILHAIVPDIAHLLGRPVQPASELSGVAGQQRLILTIVDIIKRQTHPLLILLEDLQWASESLEVLKPLLRFLPGVPVMIVGSYRDDERPDLPSDFPLMTPIRLERLKEDAIADLSASMLGETGRNPALVALLQTETEGNAFFMVEVVRALAEEAGRLSEIGRAELPETVMAGGVQQIIHRRLAKMPDWTQTTLRLAAVAGRVLDLDVLQMALTGYDSEIGMSPLALIDGLLASGTAAAVLEVAENRWRFSHDKLRAAVLADLTPDERPMLHRRVAEALETHYSDPSERRERAEILMEHWHAAGNKEKAFDYLELAADQIISLQAAFKRAYKLASDKLELVDTDAQRLRILWIIAQAAELMGSYDEADTYYQQGLALAEALGDRSGIGRGLLGLSAVHRMRGQTPAALPYGQRSLAVYQDLQDGNGIARALDNLGGIYMLMGDFVQAAEHFTQSAALHQQLGDPVRVARSMNNLGVIATNTGNFEESTRYFTQVSELFRKHGEKRGLAQTLNNLGILAANHGDLEGARQYLEQALEAQRALDDRHTIAFNLTNLGGIAAYQGDYPAALRYYDEALTILRDLGDVRGICNLLVSLAPVEIALDNDEGARRHLIDGLSMAYDSANATTITEALVGLARLEHRAGRSHRATELLSLADQHPATMAEIRTMHIAPLKTELEAALPADDFAAAWDRGSTQDLEATARAILDEFSTTV